MAKMNSRWRKGAERYRKTVTVEDTRWVRERAGSRYRRLETDSPTEVAYCERRHEQTGWHRGARITKRPMTFNL